MPGRRRRGESRSAILHAGYLAIAELGYRGATTAEICRRAGVSSGTFFHYFATKEDLLLSLLGSPRDGEPALPGPAGAAGPHDPADEAPVERIIDAVIDEAADPHLPAFIREVSQLAGLPRVAAAVEEQRGRRHAELVEALSARPDASPARTSERVLALELLIEGFESLLATRDDLDPGAAARALRELSALVLRPESAKLF